MPTSTVLKSTRVLRYHWVVFTLLIFAGLVGSVLKYSPLILHNHPKGLVAMAIHGVVFVFFVAATYLHKRPLWYVVISVILVKILLLYAFYLINENYAAYEWKHNEDYFKFLGLLGNYGYGIGDIMFGNNLISLVLLSVLYAYWLKGCHNALQQLDDSLPRVLARG